ncbi:uncharacterized protein LY89DRAFT_636366 [Mollisia scopiformis]|uniref:Uncharacterized protein n=1 Tax=Mollisia scopiformis TaxID=149040 RepID=A0A194XQQ5_MOLSC|nr:uncharacterized protein LY89DRAFT_636366 [Mollisia scopiformis]KUJ22389.1 hypothetical protein LY89DRAFT_636366 [Mollisia scopiformis]
MDNLQDRQDVPIWNAIEAKNFKQALKLVDKRLAKKSTDYLEALKIYIRSLLPQVSEKSAVILHLEDVVARKAVLSDLAAIELYEDALEEVLPGSREVWIKTIGELRWRCIKAVPKNEDTSLACLQSCLSRDDLDHARQIANSLEKNFPNSHLYIFWNITSMFMFSISPQCPENQRKIWGGLALGQIGKLAAATRQATDMKQLPIRSIQTPQELLLLDRITEVFGKSENRLEYLQDKHLGPESTVAKGEWSLWRLRLKLMTEANHWQDLFDLCGTLLKRARTPNDSNQLVEASFSDWTVWEAYLKSASKLENRGNYNEIREEVEAHLDPACEIDKGWKRNASLAKVKLSFECSASFSQNAPSIGPSDKLSSQPNVILDYLQEYGDASTAYNDIRQFVEVLKPDERSQLMSMLEDNTALEKPQQPTGPVDPEAADISDSRNLSTASKITRAVNRLKLKHLIKSSIPEQERRQSFAETQQFKCSSCANDCGVFCRSCLVQLAEESVQSYRSAISDDGQITKSLLSTDRHPADDFCVLAAMCLIKLGRSNISPHSENLKSSGIVYLLQAMVLLESAWLRSKSNFQLSLMLVRLYSHLGCGSLAMRAYQRLFLKEVQLDTLSYTMFDRISTLHPHPIHDSSGGSSNTRTLIEQLQKQQKLYKTSREHINKNIWLSFKHGSYNSIFEFREVTQKLSHSISAVMSVVETNRIHRFITSKVPAGAIRQMYGLIPADVESRERVLSDNNDYETFPNFESSRAPGFEELSRFIPGPSESRYRVTLLAERIMLIVDPSPELNGERSILQQSLSRHIKQDSTSKVGVKSMTRAEQIAAHAHRAMAIILTESCDQELWLEGDFKTRLEGLNQELSNRLEELAELIGAMETVIPAFQTTLNAIYTAYEVGRSALNFCKYLSTKGKAVHLSQTEASKKVTQAAEQLIRVVMEKCAFIKKGLDEGGWIDKVLESVFPDSQTGSELSLTEAVRKVTDEVFMEEWAGDVVESWKDSIAGFSYIKIPTKV